MGKYRETIWVDNAGEPALVWDTGFGNSHGQGGLPWRNELRFER